MDLINEGDLIIAIEANGLHCSGADVVYEIMRSLKLDYFSPAPFSTENKTYGNFDYSYTFIFSYIIKVLLNTAIIIE